ncbi:DUF4846 domain-containing protein [Vaginella massiliensis]|uniref:DUF4846 domain-containing protein n=1 Tax=Vaginella massiliensis TaxID=1816680 RepID=UPI0037534AC0
MKKWLILSWGLLFLGCSTVNDVFNEGIFGSDSKATSLVNIQTYQIVNNRIPLPTSFIRILAANDYAYFISRLNFKPIKNFTQEDDYIATVNTLLVNKKKQFNTNAAYRLYYEYLFQEKNYDAIKFSDYKEIQPFTAYSSTKSYEDFLAYLKYAFQYLDNSSLENDTQNISLKNIQIGDMFYHYSYPKSNVVLVLDLAEDTHGNKIMLLGQSIDASNAIHIINNKNNPEISPWYYVKEGEILTPEWRFYSEDLVRFK